MRLCRLAYCCALLAVATAACKPQSPPRTASSRDVVASTRQHVPGEVIVQFRADTSSARIHDIVIHVDARVVKRLGSPFTYLVRSSSEHPVDELVVRLRDYSEVLHAEPNRVLQIEPPRTMPGFKSTPRGQ